MQQHGSAGTESFYDLSIIKNLNNAFVLCVIVLCALHGLTYLIFITTL